MHSNKHKEALKLSNEILKNIELSEIPLEQICLKCIRLARLCDDSDHEKAFKLEVSGYENSPSGILPDLWRIGKIANRIVKDKKGQELCSLFSISQLTTIKTVSYKRLEQTNDPDVSINFTDRFQHIALMNKPHSILSKNTSERQALSQQIIDIDYDISKRIEFIHSYVHKTYYKLRFENEIHSALENLSDSIVKNISKIAPEGRRKIVSVINNLKSNNDQDWKNILVTCRNLLKEIATTLEPKSNKKYYDVLKSYAKNSSLSKVQKSLLVQDIDTLIEPLNEGAHDKPITQKRAEELFIRVCLCASNIINAIT